MIRRLWPGLLLLLSGLACAQGGGVSTLNFNVINPTNGQCLTYVGNTSGGVWVNSGCGAGGGITALTGDVTASGSGSVAASVVRVNGLAVPASQTCVGTNSSSQFITGSCGGTPGGSSGAIQYNNAGAFGGITLGSNTLLGNSGSGAAALTSAQAISVLSSQTPNAQTGTTYTLVLGDANNEVTMSNASANTLTIPTNASVAYAVGTLITVQQINTGLTTVSPASGVTIQSPEFGSSATQGYPMGGNYGFIQLQKVATNTWQVIAYKPGPGTMAITGTCTNSASTTNATAGSITLSSAGNCTIILTPAGILPPIDGWTGTMSDSSQPTVPGGWISASSATALIFSVPTAVVTSDKVFFQLAKY